MSDDVAGRAWRPGARPACVVPARPAKVNVARWGAGGAPTSAGPGVLPMSPDVVAGPGRLWVQNDCFLQVRSVRPHPRGSTDCYKPGTGK
jgi:hypothetical protein